MADAVTQYGSRYRWRAWHAVHGWAVDVQVWANGDIDIYFADRSGEPDGVTLKDTNRGDGWFVMQSAGCRDSTGKEIFEDDFLQIQDDIVRVRFGSTSMEWQAKSLSGTYVEPLWCVFCRGPVTVLGNKYEDRAGTIERMALDGVRHG